MTMPKTVSECPICGRVYGTLMGHLQRGHGVTIVQERSILLKDAVPSRTYQSKRLDKHMDDGHQEMPAHERQEWLKEAKWRHTIEMLDAVDEGLDEPYIGPEPEGSEGCAALKKQILR